MLTTCIFSYYIFCIVLLLLLLFNLSIKETDRWCISYDLSLEKIRYIYKYCTEVKLLL